MENGHKAECVPFAGDSLLIFKPDYEDLEAVVPLSGFKRSFQGHPDGEAPRRKHSEPAVIPLSGGNSVQLGKSMIIKVQRSTGRLQDAMLVYNRTRTLMCYLLERDQPQEYKALSKIVQERGTYGFKAYFTAELLSPDQLAIKATDILATQPW